MILTAVVRLALSMGNFLEVTGTVFLTLLVPHFFLIVAKMSLQKHSVPYWSNPPFLIVRHSGTLVLRTECQRTECQNIKNLKYLILT